MFNTQNSHDIREKYLWKGKIRLTRNTQTINTHVILQVMQRKQICSLVSTCILHPRKKYANVIKISKSHLHNIWNPQLRYRFLTVKVIFLRLKNGSARGSWWVMYLLLSDDTFRVRNIRRTAESSSRRVVVNERINITKHFRRNARVPFTCV